MRNARSSVLGLCLIVCAGLACESPASEDSDDTGDGDGTEETGDEPTLFDERGVWSVEQYALDGGPLVDISAVRANRFLLRFKPEDQVVAAAACAEQDTDVDINGSNCTNAALASWSCECFAYTFAGEQMVWQAFTPVPGEPPPTVGASGHALTVAVPPGGGSSYEFRPLPPGLFNSDGVVSKHVFQHKADEIWTDVDVNVDGTPDLEACSRSCFASEAGG
jgi:hypothetical protein